jgi:glutamine---fructose-6-phosphate transaminase (isomerizing)
VPAMSLPPSIASVYQSGMDLSEVLFIAISQSGRSPDLVAGAAWAARQGAYVVTLTNDDTSPVAAASHSVLPLWAGPEQSVAATKSFLTSMAAVARLVGDVMGDRAFSDAVSGLPDTLGAALGLEWDAAAPALIDGPNAYVVGRGPGLAAAYEMALKLKETSAMHAEAFSTAEVMHGPLGLLRKHMPVLVVGQSDETLAGVRELAFSIEARGALVFRAFEGATGPGSLPVVPDVHPTLAPIAAVQSFYPLASMLSLARGLDPDRPPHLKKVTETR